MRTIVIAATCLGLLASAASAQTAGPVTSDARCLLTMAALSSNKANQPAAIPGIYYFAGRIRAREPGFDFATRLKPIGVTMSPQDFEAETKRCGPMIIDVLKGMQAAQQSFAPPKPATPPQK